MKLDCVLHGRIPWKVAPRTGARIETHPNGVVLLRSWSPPARGRGLKQLRSHYVSAPHHRVAPRTGARIETTRTLRQCCGLLHVAPRTGARIETARSLAADGASIASPPARGRGLKLQFVEKLLTTTCCRPPHGGAD